MKFFKYLKYAANWVKSYFKGKEIVQKPIETPAVPVTDFAKKIADTWEKHISKYIGKLETSGKNRGPILDKIIKGQGGGLGDAYCIWGQHHVADEVKRELGIEFADLVKTGSSQRLWAKTPEKYKHSIGKRGDLAIFQWRVDPSKGHGAWVKSDQVGKYFDTIEFNTNGGGSREGEGCYPLKRTTDGSKMLRLLGFIRVSDMAVKK